MNKHSQERASLNRARLLAELARAESQRDKLEAALNEILRHTGANEYDDCQARREGEQHSNCRSVIFDIARIAVSAQPASEQPSAEEMPREGEGNDAD